MFRQNIMNYLCEIALACIILCFNIKMASSQESYVYGDTLKSVVNISSGNYADVDSVNYYIFLNVDDAIAGSYISNGKYILKSGLGDVDSLFVASWPIPISQIGGIYYFTSVMSYGGAKLRSKTDLFRVGPITSTDVDTLGGFGYIDDVSVDALGEQLGPVYLPGNIPAYNADVLAYFHGTGQFVSSGKVDALGKFTIWVPDSGVFDVKVVYPGYQFSIKTTIVPTVP